MDQFVVDVSHIPDVQLNDEVVLVGRQGQAVIRAEEVAALMGTINLEITTALLPRTARVYYRGGQIVESEFCVDCRKGKEESVPNFGLSRVFQPALTKRS
jgi:hypothetical protein